MEYTTLRDSNLKISSIVLGTAFRGGLVEQMPKVIGRAIDLGITTFDTGGYVRNGVVTEEVLGQVIKDRRQDVILAVKQVPPAARELETRLRRLQTDYIDILEILPCRCDKVCKSGYPEHVEEPHYPVSEAMEQAEALVQKGVVRYLGVSRYTTAQLLEAEAALKETHLLLDQLHYNLAAREVGEEVMPYCRDNNITILAHSPLGAGLLWGDDSSINKDRYARYGFDTPEKLAKYRDLIGVLGDIAQERGKAMAQVAVNWVLCQSHVLPIIGPDTVEHLEENCGAVGWRLGAEELGRIDAVVAELSGLG